VKTLADQLRADRICAPLKSIPAATREAIEKLQTAETPEERLAIMRELHRHIEDKISEAQREI